MTWTHVQSWAVAITTSGTTVTGTGAASSAGNQLTAHLNNSGSGTWTLPAGWVQAKDPAGNPARALNSGNDGCEIWYLPPSANPGGITSVLCTSSATARLEVQVDEDHTDVASPVITVTATGTGVAGAAATCPVTTSAAPNAGDMVKCCFHRRLTTAAAVTWNNPSGFSLSGSDTASATHHLYAGYQLAAPGGAQTVTGKTTTAADNAFGWAGTAAAFTATPPGGAAGAGFVGCFMNPAIWGGGTTEQQAISNWTQLTSRPLTVRRAYYGTVPLSTALTPDLLADAAAGRQVAFNFKPAYLAPYSQPDFNQIDAFLSNCKAAGLNAVASLYAEPYTAQTQDPKPGLVAAFPGMWAFYVAAIRGNGYPAVVNFGSFALKSRNEGQAWPGDSLVDHVAIDYYCSSWKGDGRPSGTAPSSLDLAAAFADRHKPNPIPFGVYEFNSSRTPDPNSVPAGSKPYDSQADATAFWGYLQSKFTDRLNRGLVNGPIILFNSGSGASSLNSPVIGTPDTWGNPEYRDKLQNALFDALNGSSGTQPPGTVNIASEIDIALTMVTTLATSPPVPLSVPGGPPGLLPQLYAELGLHPSAAVAAAGLFLLDDPVYGRLGFARLGDSTVWTDIAGLMRTAAISRPSTRVQGPLLTYQAGTCTVVWDNSDGRLDPDNPATPYLDASGASQIHAMVPFRLRATWAATTYTLISTFADGWAEGPVTYDAGYGEMTMPSTDGFKILNGVIIPAAAPAGDGELSGARISRILTAARWFTDHRRIAAGDSQVTSTTMGDTALNLLQLTADTEIGELYIAGDGTLVFRDRHAILTEARSASSQATFGDAGAPGVYPPVYTATYAGELPYAGITRADDDTPLANDVQITRPGGTLQEAADNASTATYLFPRSYARSDVLLTSDAEALAYAQWVLYVSKTAERRFETVTIDPLADPANLWPQVLGREIGDRVTIIRRPQNSGATVIRDCFIRGIAHDIDAVNQAWSTTWTLQDATRYGSFLVLDDPVAGRLGHNALAF